MAQQVSAVPVPTSKLKKAAKAVVKTAKASKAKAKGENSCLCACGGKTGGFFQMGHDARYKSLPPEALPVGECLKDTVDRFLPLWNDTIAPAIRSGERVLIAAHGNSLRALVKLLDGVSDEEILELNIPTGIPLVYELEDDLTSVRGSRYLGDPEAAKRAAEAVANQGKG